jgi:hypothetical protein
MDMIVGILLFVLTVYMYFLPSTIAKNRDHNNCTAITALNITLGWTFLGWVIALVWSLTENTYYNTRRRNG